MDEIIDKRFSFLFTHTVPIAPTCRTEATQLLFPLCHSCFPPCFSVSGERLKDCSFFLQRKLIDELHDLLIC